MRRGVRAALATGAGVGLLAILNSWARWNVGPVPRHLPGEPHFYQWREGAVYYEVAGPRDAPPVLLVHGINAAASSYEMRQVFARLSGSYRVYLPDLLGFGRSERPPLWYTADTYIDLWCDFVRDVIGAPAGAQARPAHVIASSLSAAHVVAAAARHPERFASLLLICPTGVEALATPPGLPGQLLYLLFRVPVLGTALFNALASRPSLAAFLRGQIYANPGLATPQMISDYYVTAHQPGAKWAPAAFVTGRLNRSVTADFARLPQRLRLVWGRAARFTPVTQAEGFLALRPDVPLDVFDRAGLLPHDEQPEAFGTLAEEFLAPQIA